MKLWIDDLREPPTRGYRWCKSVTEAKRIIFDYNLMYKVSGGKEFYKITLIDLDHDAGDFAQYGGDYIELLNWLEAEQDHITHIPIFHLHTMNPVGAENMRAIIRHNGWIEKL